MEFIQLIYGNIGNGLYYWSFQTCLSEQEGATQGIDADIELFSTKELAYYMTLFDWDLFW